MHDQWHQSSAIERVGTRASSGGAPEPDENDAPHWAPNPAPASGRAHERETAAERFHTPDKVAYVRFRCGDHAEVHRVKGATFRQHLNRLYYRAEGRALGGAALAAALDDLEARAVFDGPERAVYRRVGPGPGQRIVLDLCDERWRAVVIQPGWWWLTDRPPVMFVRGSAMQPLPEPVRGGRLTELVPLLNLKSHDDWLLVAAWLAASVRPTGPYPVLHPRGEQGTAKTTFGRMLRRLFDPNEAELRAQPREERELAVSSRHGWALCYDNVSTIPRWLSDALCRVSTGGAFCARTLRTDDEETTFTFQRPVLITSVEDVIDQPDLLDRSLAVELEPIPDHRRKTEGALWAEFDAARPRILGGLLDVVAGALELLPGLRAEGRSLPRMADFALFGEAVARVLGERPGRFLEVLWAARSGTDQEAIEGSAVAQAFLDWIRRRRVFTGTYTDLLDQLNAAVGPRKPQGWPKNARCLSGLVRSITPNLRRLGIEVAHSRVGHAKIRTVTITSDPATTREP